MKSVAIFLFGFLVGATVVYFLYASEQTSFPIKITTYENRNLYPENKIIKIDKEKDLKTEPLSEPKIAVKVESSIVGSDSITVEPVSLPTQEELSEYKRDFHKSIGKFHSESIDYDWANQSEFGFYEQFEFLPDEIQDSLLSFQCRTEHCVLELNDVDFYNYWASLIGKLIDYKGGTFGRIHIEPYPSPNSKQDYTIIMERLKIANKSN